MIYPWLFAAALAAFIVLEWYVLKYERRKQQNQADKEYYEHVRKYSEAMEQEIATLKIYRHDLARYIRFLEKLSSKTDSEAVKEYMDLLRRENLMVQDLEEEAGESITDKLFHPMAEGMEQVTEYQGEAEICHSRELL